MAKIIELILTEERVGTGIDSDPIRLVPQLFTKDGILIASYDSETKETFFNPNFDVKD